LYSRLREEARSPGKWPVKRLLTVPPRKVGRPAGESKIDGVPHEEVIRAAREEIAESDRSDTAPVNVSSSVPQLLTVPAAESASDNSFYNKELPLVRQRCRRLDEIEHSMELLDQERRQILDLLEKGA
jgi:hypothetical protein